MNYEDRCKNHARTVGIPWKPLEIARHPQEYLASVFGQYVVMLWSEDIIYSNQDLVLHERRVEPN